MSLVAPASLFIDQAMAIQNCMDGTFGRRGHRREMGHQPLTDLGRAPMGPFLLDLQNQLFNLEWQFIGLAIRSAATVCKSFQTTFPVSVDDLVTGMWNLKKSLGLKFDSMLLMPIQKSWLW